jgi:SnoaL-like domain
MNIEQLGAVVDRLAVYDLIVRYARALDSRDWAMLSTCFLADAVVEYRNATVTGYAAIEVHCRRALAGMDDTQHIVCNHAVTFVDGVAHSHCYLHAQHTRLDASGGQFLTLGGSYHDRIELTHDGWRIQHRRLKTSWVSGNYAVLDQAGQSSTPME